MSEFTEEFEEFLQHTVQVETFDSSGFEGDRWKPSIPVAQTMVTELSQVIQDSGGDKRTSTATVQIDLGVESHFALKSRVTLPSGRRAKVIRVDRFEMVGWPSHAVVYLA